MDLPSKESINSQKKRKNLIKDAILVVSIIIAVIIGIILGLGLRTPWTANDKRKIFYLRFPGQLLLNMLQCLIFPLIVSSLITATALLDQKASRRLGLGAIIYCMTTTLTSVVLGIILVLAIHPGNPSRLSVIRRSGSAEDAKPIDAIMDLIRNCFPSNLVTMCFKRTITEIAQEEKTVVIGANKTVKKVIETPILKDGSGMNVLGVVVFSLAFGCVINHLQERGKPLLYFFEALNDATMCLVTLVIWYSPIGLIFLIAAKFIETDNIADVAARLGMYMVTVLVGLAIHSVVILPTIYYTITHKNPGIFAFNMLKAILMAWGTASSSATLPVTMECLVKKNRVNEQVVRFVAPIGVTINMDGTALYEAVASIFIAQLKGIHMGLAKVIIVSLTATAAAIGASGVPHAGLVTMVIVLTAVNLPTEDVTLVLAVDWFLDRFRTAVNIWGDSIGAGVLNHIFYTLFRGNSEELLTSSDADVNESLASVQKFVINKDTVGREQTNGAHEEGSNAVPLTPTPTRRNL